MNQIKQMKKAGSYVSPEAVEIGLGCEGILCNSRFENNTHEGYYGDNYLPGSFTWD